MGEPLLSVDKETSELTDEKREAIDAPGPDPLQRCGGGQGEQNATAHAEKLEQACEQEAGQSAAEEREEARAQTRGAEEGGRSGDSPGEGCAASGRTFLPETNAGYLRPEYWDERFEQVSAFPRGCTEQQTQRRGTWFKFHTSHCVRVCTHSWKEV
jgi:hypothetical protein